MTEQSFLIIHGLGGSGPDHWQTWLSHELSGKHFHVTYPSFTNCNAPVKDVWLNELSSALEKIPEENELTVIAHSLGCLLWLHYTERQNKPIANKVILVAPPSPASVIIEANTFFPVPLHGDHLQRAAEETLLIFSTNDPYCSVEDSAYFSTLGVPSLSFPNMGHINPASGYGKWPWILGCSTNTTIFI